MPFSARLNPIFPKMKYNKTILFMNFQ